MPKSMKIYLNLLQLCIVNHRLFFSGHSVEGVVNIGDVDSVAALSLAQLTVFNSQKCRNK